jgi:hypothetical protein
MSDSRPQASSKKFSLWPRALFRHRSSFLNLRAGLFTGSAACLVCLELSFQRYVRCLAVPRGGSTPAGLTTPGVAFSLDGSKTKRIRPEKPGSWVVFFISQDYNENRNKSTGGAMPKFRLLTLLFPPLPAWGFFLLGGRPTWQFFSLASGGWRRKNRSHRLDGRVSPGDGVAPAGLQTSHGFENFFRS